MERSLIERFFQSEITHTEVAAILNQQPEQISAILGAIFIVALKSSNALTRLNIFPELSAVAPLDVEKAHRAGSRTKRRHSRLTSSHSYFRSLLYASS